MFRKQMKQKAKDLLSGIWGRAVALLLALAAVSVFCSLLERTVVSLTGLSTLEQLFSPLLLYGSVTISMRPLLFAIGLFVGSLFLSFLFGTPLRQGSVSWYYGRASGEIYPVSKAFSWYASLKRWLLHFSYLPGGGVAEFPFVRPFCGAGPGGADCVADCLLPVFSGAVYPRR